jgi:DNA-binding NarL/FixJ family response regulator
MRCLIVDDSPQFLESATRMLEREGFEVVGVASTTAQAVERFEEHRPDVTLVDVSLGSESGLDVVKLIPASTILISTRGAEELAPLVEASPALGFLEKAHLSADRIRRLIEDHRLVHEAFPYTVPDELIASSAPPSPASRRPTSSRTENVRIRF